MKQTIFSYDTPVILLGGGDINWPVLQHYVDLSFPIVAADGAANALETTAIVPDRIIGDLDSLTRPETWSERTSLHHVTEQDSTDFEKCLYSIEAPLHIGFGFLGQRLDHSLAAIHVMAKYATTDNVLLVDMVDAIFVRTNDVSLDLPVGSRISILPTGETTFLSSEGLAYPLDGLTLKPGTLISSSNKTVAPTVTIKPAAGNSAAFAVIAEAKHHQQMRAAIS